ncbi:TetR/AcrR family transcriptional regulator [Streptomyces profundus]|uniref:TetR/AcrR family transcriptional regulator n=1 Tax=Streptomyces profundus TaxID=2867410 RepID=UPI001D16CD2E|nr:TetR family transcriptional regulator [Streptomyces sp. MA3_2.13]UED85640.1 TetR family transcriptional regulator [Streptomyces sp. MA3_2.13]
MSPAAPRRRGRPSRAEQDDGTPGARERILASARDEFAARGYDKASIRAIARGADVNPALVHHYFGTKEQVFAAAVVEAIEPAAQGLADQRAATELAGPTEAPEPADFGERFTRMFFGIWQNPTSRGPMLAVIRSAMHNETAATIFRRLLTRRILTELAGQLTAPDAELRAELAATQLVGVVLARHVLRIEPLASTESEELIRRLAPVVQYHLFAEPGTPLPARR